MEVLTVAAIYGRHLIVLCILALLVIFSEVMFEVSMTVVPFKLAFPIVLLAIGFEVLVAYLIRQEL